MGFDHKEFVELKDNFKLFQKDFERWIRGFLMRMAMRALAQTIKLTPVGTGNNDGHLRDRWELSDVMRKGDELIVVLFNPKLYASFVEEGHMQYSRWVPGYWDGDVFIYVPGYKEDGMMLRTMWIPGMHMARIAITKIEFEIPQRFRREFKQYVKKMGVGG